QNYLNVARLAMRRSWSLIENRKGAGGAWFRSGLRLLRGYLINMCKFTKLLECRTAGDAAFMVAY
ncbi:hypothetical protein, partial [Bifidobacterium vespertilionis]|uniref:hypothetical protein n=1 Tax=Bifidobacterium vespertilionis TaxID=2562524 RepID=UPI001CC32C6F